jgi:hypothetical protein
VSKFILDEAGQSDSGENLPRGMSGKAKIIFGLIAVLVFGGSTLATNLTISDGRIEFGQGIFRVSACDSFISVLLLPTAASYDGYSKVQSIQLIGLNPQQCSGNLLRFRMYGESDNAPLKIYVGVTESDTAVSGSQYIDSATSLSVFDTTTAWNSATTSYLTYARNALTLVDEAGNNIGFEDDYLSISYSGSRGTWTIFFKQPLAFMRDVARITVESARLAS